MNDLRLTNKYYYLLWDKFGPFKYDIMASATNVKCDEKGNKLRFFQDIFQKVRRGASSSRDPKCTRKLVEYLEGRRSGVLLVC